MGLSKKRKQHLSLISTRAAENQKHRKIDRENERKKRFLKKLREEEDFWDEPEELQSESSSNESNIEDSSLDEPSSDENNMEVNNKRGDHTREGLGDQDGGLQLGVEERSFRPVWKDDAGSYLRGIKGCGSSATEKRERRRNRELEKSASQTRSIVEIFSAQRDKNHSHDKDVTPDAASAAPPPKALRDGRLQKVETLFEKQTRAAHDLGKLLCHKAKQISRYGHVLDSKSNLYRRHQMVQSFLWMQLSRKKDNPGLNRQSLARIVAQSFNRRAYTGRKIIHWERSWIKFRVVLYLYQVQKSDQINTLYLGWRMKTWFCQLRNGVKRQEIVRLKLLDITLYSLAQFVNRYLPTNRSELARKKLDTPEGLEQSILAESTIQENEDIDRQA